MNQQAPRKRGRPATAATATATDCCLERVYALTFSDKSNYCSAWKALERYRVKDLLYAALQVLDPTVDCEGARPKSPSVLGTATVTTLHLGGDWRRLFALAYEDTDSNAENEDFVRLVSERRFLASLRRKGRLPPTRQSVAFRLLGDRHVALTGKGEETSDSSGGSEDSGGEDGASGGSDDDGGSHASKA